MGQRHVHSAVNVLIIKTSGVPMRWEAINKQREPQKTARRGSTRLKQKWEGGGYRKGEGMWKQRVMVNEA